MVTLSKFVQVAGFGLCCVAGSVSAYEPAPYSVFGVPNNDPIIQLADDYFSCAKRAEEKKEYCLGELNSGKAYCEAEYRQKMKQCKKKSS